MFYATRMDDFRKSLFDLIEGDEALQFQVENELGTDFKYVLVDLDEPTFSYGSNVNGDVWAILATT